MEGKNWACGASAMLSSGAGLWTHKLFALEHTLHCVERGDRSTILGVMLQPSA